VIFLIPVATKGVQHIESLARNNAFPLITSTLASCDIPTNRGIIQNEALIALNIIMMLANSSLNSQSSNIVRQNSFVLFFVDMICEKLKEANCHENLKAFFQQDIQHAEIINNLLQLIHLMRKQSSIFVLVQEQIRINFSFFVENLLTNDQLKEYKPLLINIRSKQNSNGQALIDRTLEVLQNEIE